MAKRIDKTKKAKSTKQTLFEKASKFLVEDFELSSSRKVKRKKFGLYAIWGAGASEQFDNEEKVSMNPDNGAVNYYSFNTKKERSAFLLGANEANGWIEYSFVEEEESRVEKNILSIK
jgi:hypothetical protein